MQFTVRDVTRFFSVSESTLTRWIKQRGLPAQHVNGQYRFHRSELLEWATANQIKFSLEMLDDLETADEPPPSLAAALEAGGIFYNVQDTSKERALRALVQVLPLPESIDRELILRLLLVREAAATTAIGDGIALPHVRNPIVLHVDRPMITLCFLERPVEFGAGRQAGAVPFLADLPHDAEPLADVVAAVVRPARPAVQGRDRASRSVRRNPR